MSEEEFLRYDKMVEGALRGVVRSALEEVEEHGLMDDHHFYITFHTEYPGVQIPDYLRERYPNEMTIVLQYQFYDLEVDEEGFGVTLSFNNVPERLEIPIQAISIFADPSVNFALQFQPLSSEDDYEDYEMLDEDEADARAEDAAGKDGKTGDDDDDSKEGKVISLDNFRKK